MRRIYLIAAVSITVGACTAAESRNDGAAQQGGGGPPAMPVEVAVAQEDTVIEEISATGEIEAVQAIELRPEVEGRLVEIFAREGREVTRGTPLFKVDDAELRAQVAQLEAERELARQALERTRRLMEENASSEADLETAQANERSKAAQLELQQVRLDRTVVRAPFTGVVGERLVSLGDYVNTSTRLVTLQTVDPQRAAFDVPERYAPQLRVGQEVSFEVAAVADREFFGVVDFVNPVVQQPARTIRVKAMVRNRDRSLKAGMFIEARLTTRVIPDAVVIPEDAILPLQGADFVWVIVDGAATRRQVELGVRTPGMVQIRSGVEAGEQVVVGGLERLMEGAPVMATVVERTSPER